MQRFPKSGTYENVVPILLRFRFPTLSGNRTEKGKDERSGARTRYLNHPRLGMVDGKIQVVPSDMRRVSAVMLLLSGKRTRQPVKASPLSQRDLRWPS